MDSFPFLRIRRCWDSLLFDRIPFHLLRFPFVRIRVCEDSRLPGFPFARISSRVLGFLPVCYDFFPFARIFFCLLGFPFATILSRLLEFPFAGILPVCYNPFPFTRVRIC